MTAPRPQPVLLTIDWQKAWRDLTYWGRRNANDAESHAHRLLQAWRAAGAPVIHVRHDSTEAASPLRPDRPGNAFEEFIDPRPGEPIYGKQVNSAFIGTTLEADLRAAGHRALVITGVSTDHCVSTTTRMAANFGFEVTLAGEACFTFDRKLPSGGYAPAERVHDIHLASLDGEFATVRRTADILAALSAARPAA